VCSEDEMAGVHVGRKNNKKHLKNVGPIGHCEPFYIVIHQVSLLPPLSHATCASMSTTTTTTTTTRDIGDRYGPKEWAQQEAFEKCWAHSPLRAAVTLPFTRCRYCCTPAITIAQAACDVHDNDNNDNAWQRGPLWPHGMGPISQCNTGVGLRFDDRSGLLLLWFVRFTYFYHRFSF